MDRREFVTTAGAAAAAAIAAPVDSLALSVSKGELAQGRPSAVAATPA